MRRVLGGKKKMFINEKGALGQSGATRGGGEKKLNYNWQ